VKTIPRVVPDMAASPAQELDADAQAQLQVLETFLATVQHFFKGCGALFAPIDDPRDPQHIRYPLEAVLFTGLLMYVCRLGARRQINHLLRGNGPSDRKFQALFDVASCPHGDTLNETFKRLAPAQVQSVVTGMVRTLIRNKVLYPYRLLERYFVIAIDGSGRLTFPERHCDQCLTRTHHGHTTYYHPVLEAKLVLPNGWAFSLLTEFIENPAAQPTKQDCELQAFYRLAERLKQAFPRLPICLSLDGLFAGGPTMSICEGYDWKYLIVLTDDDIPYLNTEFAALWPLVPENHLHVHTGSQLDIHQDYRWVNHITYVDTERESHTLAVLECVEAKPDADGQRKTTRFKWLTNFRVQATQVQALANHGGRIRWKIENEGFNVQKNGGFGMEHAYTRDPTASKIFYLLLQMAHLIAQLMADGSLFRRAFPNGVGSAKNLAFRLLEAWRNLRVGTPAIYHLLCIRRQIRFQPP
jgi:hypothetical protein